MTARSLRDLVVATRTQHRWTAGTLQARSGLSARTLRDIEAGRSDRRYSVRTLGALDRAFDWPAGTAWRAWRHEAAPETPAEELAEQMRELRAAVVADVREELEAQRAEIPAWAIEIIDLMRLMGADDRRRLTDLASRLAPR